MFETIHNDSLHLRSVLDIPSDPIVLCSDSGHTLDTDAFQLMGEFALNTLSGFPRGKAASSPVLKYYRGMGVDLLHLDSKLRLEMGYEAQEIAYVVRLFGHMGIHTMFLVEQVHFVLGEMDTEDCLFLIEDQVNFMGVNPLTGPNHEAWGPRFPDMSAPFDSGLSRLVSVAAGKAGVEMRTAVYAGFTPERLAEMEDCIHHMRRAGANVAGSSLVLEVIAARHMGIRICAMAYSPSTRSRLSPQLLHLILEGVRGLK